MRASIGYVCHGIDPSLDPNSAESYLFDASRTEYDRDIEAWKAKSEASSEAGKLGAEKRWSNDSERHTDDGERHTDDSENGKEEEKEEEEGKEEEEEKDRIPSFAPSISGADAGDDLERMIEGLSLHHYQGSDRMFTKAVENAIRTMWREDHIRVNGRNIPRGAVRDVLRTLTIDDIDYILAKLEDQNPDEPVNNGQAYLISCIYNAPADRSVNEKRLMGRRHMNP